MLSRLEVACLELPDIGLDDADDVDGVRPNTHYERRAVIENAFPELGLYQSVRPFNPDNPQDTVVGDAIDDLAEI
ncbi:MAG: hypothetical protein IPL62_10250 [Caulobacteraceae bacterium]|nr:hypothetical protein [Caulobacteraceae bacterium]